jgi:hypothetical protein
MAIDRYPAVRTGTHILDPFNDFLMDGGKCGVNTWPSCSTTHRPPGSLSAND